MEQDNKDRCDFCYQCIHNNVQKLIMGALANFVVFAVMFLVLVIMNLLNEYIQNLNFENVKEERRKRRNYL